MHNTSQCLACCLKRHCSPAAPLGPRNAASRKRSERQLAAAEAAEAEAAEERDDEDGDDDDLDSKHGIINMAMSLEEERLIQNPLLARRTAQDTVS